MVEGLRCLHIGGDTFAEQVHGAGDLLVWDRGHGHAADEVGHAQQLAIAVDLLDNLGGIAATSLQVRPIQHRGYRMQEHGPNPLLEEHAHHRRNQHGPE